MADPLSNDNDVLSAGHEQQPAADPSEAKAIEAEKAKEKQAETARQKGLQQVEAAEKSMEKSSQIQKQREKDLAGPTQAAMGASQGVSAATKQRPQMQTPPGVPQKAQPDETWLALAGIIGAIGGGLTRNHMTNALAAFTGTLNGLHERNEDKFNASFRTWEAENKKVLEVNKQKMEDYRQTLDDAKLNFDQKMTELKLKAMRWDDRAMAQAAETKDHLTVGQAYDYIADKSEQFAMESKKLRDSERHFRISEQNKLEVAARRAGGAYQQSESAIELRAEMMLDGNPLATKGMSVRSLDWPRVMDAFAEKAKAAGLSAEDITRRQTQYVGEQSYQRTAGSMGARIEAASNEVNELAPLAVQAARNMPRSDFTAINQILQEGITIQTPGIVKFLTGVGEIHIPVGEKDWSDPRYNDFLVRNFSLVKAYGRAMNPQGVPRVTENAEAHAMGILSMAQSEQSYEVQVRALLNEVAASKRAVAATRAGASNPTITPEQLGLPKSTDQPPGSFMGAVNKALPFGTANDPNSPSARVPGYSAGRGMGPGGEQIPSWLKNVLPEGWTAKPVQ